MLDQLYHIGSVESRTWTPKQLQIKMYRI